MFQKSLSTGMVAVAILIGCSVAALSDDNPSEGKNSPAVGDKASDFTLNDLDGKPVSLSNVLESGPAVLVVLRGYPGYQCPICVKQFGELLGSAQKFADAKSTVLFVYPGPATDLDKYAHEFIAGKSFPANYRFVIDPDFKFTNLYGLRWNAPKETAYPSSFVIDRKGIVQFAKISHSHGNRASSTELLGELSKLSK
jgi:peroxiredoxin